MPGPKSDKVWSDEIRKAVNEYHEEKDDKGKVQKTRYLRLLATNLVKAGAAGDMQAIKEVGDRLDGKPQQAVSVTNNQSVEYMSDDELIDVIRSRRGNGAADPQAGKEDVSSVH